MARGHSSTRLVMTFPGDLPTSMAQDLVSGCGKEQQISQNLTPSKKIKKRRDKLQDQSITEMESIRISARVSLNNAANLAALAEWIVKYSE